MAITPNDFSKIWASNADTPEYTFSDANYQKGWDFVGNLPPTRAQWNAMQKSTDEKMKYVFDNFGAPLTASTVAEMTMQNRVYVYTGSETGYTAGHWYYWNGSAWTDGGVYNSNTVQVDPTLTITGAAADAKVTGESIQAIYDGKERFLFTTFPGYINSDGSIASQSATNKEVYTNKSAVSPGDVLDLSLEYGSAHSMWFVVARYDNTNTFVARDYIVGGGTQASYNGQYTVPAGTGYILFSYRTFDDATFSAKKGLSYLITDTTLSISGKAADARMTGQKFVRITKTTKNMFNPDALITMAGWTEDNGVYSGEALYLDRNFRNGLGYYPISGFKENTQYTFSLDGYTDGNEGTTGGGVHVYFYYTDSSYSSAFLLLNSATSYTRATGTSQANKTIDTIKISYGDLSHNIWHLKNIQLEEGTSVTDFFPHRIAVDTVAREAIDIINENIEPVVPYFKKYTKIADFSNATIGATYPYVRMYGLSIPPNATTKIDIVSSDDSDTNNLYFNLYSNGTRLTSVGILNGYGTRTVSLTNTYGAEITEIDAVLVKVNELNTYNITFYVGDYLPNAVDDLEAKVDALIDGNVIIPSYYETHLANAISSAQTNLANAGINGESFVFISDIHWENNEKNSPALIKEITKKLPIANTFFGGDAFNGGTQSAKIADMNDIREKFTKASPHFLSVFGNHDDDQLDGGTQFSHKEFYTFLQKQADYYVKYEAPCYYYMDNEATKTRFIVLDTGTGTPPTANAQLTWLNNIINSAPTGYHFIVFAHVIFYPQSGGSYSDPTTWIMSPFMTNVCNALDSAKSNGKDVEALFGGHCHYDWNTTTTGGIPIVLIDCDTKQTQTGNPQSAGTVNEQAFDIVTVNYSSSTIYCTRVGRGNNRTITY